MNIESAKYIKDLNDNTSTICAKIDGQEWFVPLDQANSHYAAILEWAKKDGNTIQEAD
jgi:hypothetical protein|tara:strand:- start:14 stop:187 length:174 start_codon:yes stop_codon:yes gene_type:complete